MQRSPLGSVSSCLAGWVLQAWVCCLEAADWNRSNCTWGARKLIILHLIKKNQPLFSNKSQDSYTE